MALHVPDEFAALFGREDIRRIGKGGDETPAGLVHGLQVRQAQLLQGLTVDGLRPESVEQGLPALPVEAASSFMSATASRTIPATSARWLSLASTLSSMRSMRFSANRSIPWPWNEIATAPAATTTTRAMAPAIHQRRRWGFSVMSVMGRALFQ